MMKLCQEISGGFLCDDRAPDFVVVRSVLSTARKQGGDILQTLTGNPERLTANLQVLLPLHP